MPLLSSGDGIFLRAVDAEEFVEFAIDIERRHVVETADMVVVDEDLRDGQAAARPLDHFPLAPEVDVAALDSEARGAAIAAAADCDEGGSVQLF